MWTRARKQQDGGVPSVDVDDSKVWSRRPGWKTRHHMKTKTDDPDLNIEPRCTEVESFYSLASRLCNRNSVYLYISIRSATDWQSSVWDQIMRLRPRTHCVQFGLKTRLVAKTLVSRPHTDASPFFFLPTFSVCAFFIPLSASLQH